jgi:predicted Zn-dependent protease
MGNVIRLWRIPLAVLLTTLPVLAGQPGKGVNLYTLPQELALEQQAHIVSDPLIAEYINRLGQNLALQANAPFPLTVKMIQSDEVNAFTLPGGFVYVNSSLMKMADNEAELASVIAHEIGHAAARHATRQASESKMARVATVPLSVLTGWAGLAARQSARAVTPMAGLSFSRAFETEADRLGVGYLSEAGYDPNASVDMFERIASLERKTPGAVARLFLSHPPTGDRIARTQATIAKIRKESGSYILNTTEFEAIRTLLITGK